MSSRRSAAAAICSLKTCEGGTVGLVMARGRGRWQGPSRRARLLHATTPTLALHVSESLDFLRLRHIILSVWSEHRSLSSSLHVFASAGSSLTGSFATLTRHPASPVVVRERGGTAMGSEVRAAGAGTYGGAVASAFSNRHLMKYCDTASAQSDASLGFPRFLAAAFLLRRHAAALPSPGVMCEHRSLYAALHTEVTSTSLTLAAGAEAAAGALAAALRPPMPGSSTAAAVASARESASVDAIYAGRWFARRWRR